MPPRYPPIIDPAPTLESLYTTVQQLKQVIEILTAQRAAHQSVAAVTWDDLVSLGLIEPQQVPKDKKADYVLPPS